MAMSITTTSGISFLINCTAVPSIARFTNNFNIVFRDQQGPQSLSDHGVVVSQ